MGGLGSVIDMSQLGVRLRCRWFTAGTRGALVGVVVALCAAGVRATTCAPSCADGETCTMDAECSSNFCDGSICCTPSDTSSVCGGDCSVSCGDGSRCTTSSDCENSCDGSICCTPSDTSNVCGGDCSVSCADGSACAVDADCTNLCVNDACCTPSDTAGRCGGNCATACAAGSACVVGADCTSGVCARGRCAARGPAPAMTWPGMAATAFLLLCAGGIALRRRALAQRAAASRRTR